MPEITYEGMQNVYVSFDLEVYCNTCGAGLCGESEFNHTYRRGYPSIRVNACPECLENIKHGYDSEIEDLKYEIERLEKELEKFK